MKLVDLSNPHRKKHFNFFRNMSRPHFNIVARVEISGFLNFIKEKQLPFTSSVVYFISKVANQIPEFRYRIRGEQVIEHDSVHPSFTVNTEEADVFSFCTVEYHPDFLTFQQRAITQIELMKTNPSLEDHPERDDYLFLSAIPWVSFTAFEHAMHDNPPDSVPRITWGKYAEEQGKVWMPLSVQAHHAVVDGRHTGRYFTLFQQMMNKPDRFLSQV